MKKLVLILVSFIGFSAICAMAGDMILTPWWDGEQVGVTLDVGALRGAIRAATQPRTNEVYVEEIVMIHRPQQVGELWCADTVDGSVADINAVKTIVVTQVVDQVGVFGALKNNYRENMGAYNIGAIVAGVAAGAIGVNNGWFGGGDDGGGGGGGDSYTITTGDNSPVNVGSGSPSQNNSGDSSTAAPAFKNARSPGMNRSKPGFSGTKVTGARVGVYYGRGN